MKTRRVRGGAAVDLPMTPMIDIVFLLLVFFLVTIKPMDVIAHLEVMRPSGVPGPVVPVLRVSVDADGYELNGRPIDAGELRTHLSRLGALDPRQTVVLDCSPAAAHEKLVLALNHCAEAGLGNLSVVTRRAD